MLSLYVITFITWSHLISSNSALIPDIILNIITRYLVVDLALISSSLSVTMTERILPLWCICRRCCGDLAPAPILSSVWKITQQRSGLSRSKQQKMNHEGKRQRLSLLSAGGVTVETATCGIGVGGCKQEHKLSIGLYKLQW